METVNRKLITFCFLATGVASVGMWLLAGGKSAAEPLKISYKVTRESKAFLDRLKNRLTQDTGKYGIFVYRLRDGVGYGIDADEIMPAASVMKVPIMLAVMKKVENGQLKIDSEYVLRDENKQSGSGPIEFMDVGTKLSVQQLTEYMIKNSDNTAPVVLIDMLGKDAVKKEILSLGMESTDFENNTTTAFDVGLMWRKIYEMKNEDIFNLLKDSIYEDRLPAGLPDTVDVIHKVGTGDGVWADGGIIQCSVLSAQCSVEPLVIVILNKNVDLDQAAKTVPEITKMIWEYETNVKQ